MIRNPHTGARVACATMLLAAWACAGCMLVDARKEQKRIATEVCTLEGSVESEHATGRPLVVVLLARPPGSADDADWRLADHFVSSKGGRWKFFATAGKFSIAAFEDVNADLRFQPDEPFVGIGTGREIDCAGGAQFDDLVVTIPATGQPDAPTPSQLQALRTRSAEEQVVRTLGAASALGEVVALTDPRFELANASDGMWRPLDYMVRSPPGVYFLEPYDAHRIPVLFVHGINGSPAQFAPLIAKLDRRKFQAWVYNYPSGAYLSNLADHLDQTMAKLEVQYGVRRFIVVAHSMGGLVSRGFLQRHARSPRNAQVPLFVSISTPWAGHAAAKSGVERSPVVLHVWEDMAPGSPYITSLYAQPLPQITQHHLLFTFRRSGMSGEANDGVVTLASQLDPKAQAASHERFGFDETHTSVLESAAVADLLNALLASPH